MSHTKLGTVMVLVASLLIWQGCAVGPDYERPQLGTDLPSEWTQESSSTEEQAITLQSSFPDDTNPANWRWWESFNDATLNSLVQYALVYNNDLAAAVGRVMEARAVLGGAKSSQWPTLDIGATASRSKSSEDLTGGFASPYSNYYATTATLRYEVDLWGRLSRGKEAAVASLMASEEERRSVAQRLIADVVNTWLEIREMQLQVALNEHTIVNYTHNLKTVNDRYQRGLSASLDVHLANQNLAAAQAAGPAFKQSLASAKRRLEILTGQLPLAEISASDMENSDGTLSQLLMPEPLASVPAGLPSEMLEQRPDIAAAEMRLRASVMGIGQAKAGLYPRISLTANAGSATNDLGNLLTNPTQIWSLAGNLFMPLINRGATQAQIKTAEARATQATANYRSTVLRAFMEVGNSLDQDKFQQQREMFLVDSVTHASRAVSLAEDRYVRGLDNILIALESQRRLYIAESNLLTTQRIRRAARVNLILALGGYWEEINTDADTPEGADQ